uniref:Endonuclease n=1 Tax=uncultured marine virus TaxID=186617 RepID=A0A0F7LB59_9VIRU|nr:endonuclease [uncultured marine virus]
MMTMLTSLTLIVHLALNEMKLVLCLLLMMGFIAPQVQAASVCEQALDVIGKYESDPVGGYDAVNQIGTHNGRGTLGYSGPFLRLPGNGVRKLTDLTVQEIMELQYDAGWMTNAQWIAAGKLHAVGRYQFIGRTLRRIVDKYRISHSLKFSPELQDMLALLLLRESGPGEWIGPLDKSTPTEWGILQSCHRANVKLHKNHR